jgi:predicted CopG family antitoxin
MSGFSAESTLDNNERVMHGTCMATKTISLEIDAYERLRRFKHSPRESFSEVVRRAVWPDAPPRGADILADVRARMRDPKTLPDEATLDALDRAQADTQRSLSKWTT